eukprot:CAMPEP_0202496926 /NCGR_PEP_ID=MMETSP1361-20130828/21372_1 /ASSEMBLY_ACC=CAM_ASM_000849 /TAXON_ID=210615 /ORGANISM="Staurosira complex sp., Strain CCMP2646" /LENGTH=520 /DNA_ID=CAMNT_0049128377 /DNA_START=16 /DNA_END=1578 /DNA_ORIENTATION=+
MTGSQSLYDVTIICTTDDHQAEYWMKRLSEGLCKSSDDAALHFPMVLAVSEDWGAGGAGNGLGTLYAFQKATKLAKEKYNVDLAHLLAQGEISAALYHTAGKGTRMAPLPASENNNKPGVKLPVCHNVNGTYQPITVLEAVVKQTGVYAASRKGRLSVYWGDQIFVPSASYDMEPTHHIDIMCTLLGDTAPTAQEWEAQGLEKYGVIAVLKGDERNAAQVEKVSHATAVEMLQSLGEIAQVGPSLGSFSVSAAMLQALSEEFAKELAEKTEKLDTDPHFWMPLTLSAKDYAALMKQKGIDEDVSLAHHARITAMKDKFDFGDLGLFGAVNVGSDACWWDYGQLKLYSKNNINLLEAGQDADLLRKFFAIDDKKQNSVLDGVTVDDTSCVFASKIQGGTITESALAVVTSPHVEADGAIIVNCTAKKIVAGKGSILYNLIDTSDEGIVAAPGEVIVAVNDESGDSMLLKSHMDIDGGKAWKIKLDMNEMSFEDVRNKNMDANITVIEAKRNEAFEKAASSF